MGDDHELEHGYELDSGQLSVISRAFDCPFPADMGTVSLVPWSSLRDVPYLIHTGFELALMLEGRKPLAVFSDAYPSAILDEQLAPFDPFVEQGRLVRRTIDHPFPSPKRGVVDSQPLDGIRRVCFALPGQEWRIDAYIEMWQSAEKSGWSEASERREGKLLGYTDWQCDWWAENRPGSLSRRR
ncbi:hypothetical protein LJR009_006102 [Bosea sp. LjRoot9]|uniref:hypothetical protein n=1 Tax=Bosea sp. LjRoot9 TaxID=3342341 RepID=UPI003ECDB105